MGIGSVVPVDEGPRRRTRLRVAAPVLAVLAAGRASSAARVAPEMVRALADRVELADGRVACTLAVRGYPREVEPGWLRVLEDFDGELRFCQHIEPIETAQALAEIGRDLRAAQASLLLAQARGATEDAADRAAAEDAATLRDALARGETRVFAHHLLLTVFAQDPAELAQRTAALLALLEGALFTARRCLLEQAGGYQTTMPPGRLALPCPRNFDSQALSAALPPAADEPPGPTAEVWGLDLRRRTTVAVDRFALPNPHVIGLAGSGGGKSFWLKHLLTQNLLAGRRAAVFDIQGEYAAWCQAVGGVCVRVGPVGAAQLSPLARPLGRGGDAYPDGRAWRAACAVRLRTLLELLAGAAVAVPEATVWDALEGAEAQAGSGTPTLSGVAAVLERLEGGAPLARVLGLALRGGLHAFDGSEAGGLPDTAAVVFDLRDLVGQATAVVAAAFLLLTHFVLDQLVRPEAPALTVAMDEGHHLLAHAATARFVDVLFRTGRKHGVAVCLATQSVGDLLGADAAPDAARAARGALANASVVFLMRQQNRREIQWLDELYGLGPREAEWLGTCGGGEGLVLAGRQRARVRIEAPRPLLPLFSTGPSPGPSPGPAASPPG